MASGADGEIFMIGGFACPDCDPTVSGFEDMWSFQPGRAWSELPLEAAPPPSDDFAFDRGSGRAVLVPVDGGATWTYDPAADAWEELPIEDGPGGLHGSRMAYDEGSDRLIVFSGDAFSANSLHDETWAYDTDSDTWERMDPKRSPPKRTYYALAYDSGSDRVILFGGSGPLADTWAYDYDADTWERMHPKRSPPARVYSVAAYDVGTDRVILFGGSVDEEVAAFQDTWAYDYDDDTWTRLAAEAPMRELAWHAMASSSDGVVLFGGGVTRDDYVSETWIFDTGARTWSAV